MVKVLISGGTGLIGKHLQQKLLEKNYDVAILTRNPTSKNEFQWDINEHFIDKKAFENVTHIIHLTGAGIADKRWTAKRKKELINSRVNSTNLLFKTVQKLEIPIKSFISASAIGYYGAITSNKIFTEEDTSGNDFISSVCSKWEDSVHQFNKLDISTTIFRTGIVLSKKGGALEKMNTTLLAVLGKGNQYMPWINIEDLCNLYIKAIEDTRFRGIINAVAPEHQTNKTFTKKISKSLKRIVIPINAPSFILRIILGEMASILLTGSRVSSEKATKLGFNFQFKNLEKALKNLLSK